jgi:hypothetical protein
MWYLDQKGEYEFFLKLKEQLGRGSISVKRSSRREITGYRFTLDTFLGVALIVDYYKKFPPKTVKHRIRFLRVHKLLPYALDGTWKQHIHIIKNIIKLNARMTRIFP